MTRTGASRGVDVLENRDALPRAWIVHSAKRVSQAETLQLLNSGDVNPRLTALIERQPPDLSNPEDASNDRALIKTHEVDRICLQTSSAAPGLLVLSEAYYPAWKAHVDGRPRAASGPGPAGEHAVELRYGSWYLRVGLAISLISYLLLLALMFISATARRLTG